MTIDTYVRELLSPGRSIKDADQFWEQYKSTVLENTQVKSALEHAANEQERKVLEERLEHITKENFKKYGQQYFSDTHTGSNILRYGALGANVLGGVTAAGALFALAAGGPLSALGAVSLGLGYLFAD